MAAPPVPLSAGDVLLYHGGGDLLSWAIRVKTWSRYVHAELYLGQWQSAASRNGQGVRTYPTRLYGLAAVLRPVRPLDMAAVLAFHRACVGQHYDWLGLLRFFTISVSQPKDRQFCSEYVTRLLRKGGLEPFHRDYDADLVSPGMLATSPPLLTVWSTQ